MGDCELRNNVYRGPHKENSYLNLIIDFKLEDYEKRNKYKKLSESNDSLITEEDDEQKSPRKKTIIENLSLNVSKY